MASAKRKRTDDEGETSTPRKLRTRAPYDDQSDELEAAPEVQTPSRKTRAHQIVENETPKSILKKTGLANGANVATPKSQRRLVFATPTKSAQDETPNGTRTLVRNADRSARRKSNRRLIERTINGVDSDEETLDEEETLAQQILSDAEEDDEAAAGAQEELAVPDTPSKRGRGRPKGSGAGKVGRPRKQRSPTPPQDLPSHEEYFWQNRPGGAKTSNNTLPSGILLNHDEYFQAMQAYQDRHEPEKNFLLELHSRAFDQWIFELEEGFNICLYGYGSKRTIVDQFVAHLYQHLTECAHYKGSKKTPAVVVVNGYTSGTTVKDILATIASIAIPSKLKMPNQPASLLAYILDYLSESPPPHPIPIIVNSIDTPQLRKSPTPSMLATLASSPHINLICTVDTPSFPLLWDVGLKALYQFLFHDTTTFAPYDAEIDIVESVNDLLGRSGRRIGGRDGVGFVLRSLPENARSLFKILVEEQLGLLLTDDGADFDQDDMPATVRNKKIIAAKHTSSESAQGVEYRVLYHKAVEEFVCSSEVGFRTLLKEFHDHQMVESRKDAMGTERLWIPFRQEELEGLAEDLAGDAF
ncbi:ORC2-domain-containing protein [Melanomma pulvis-pyrius CBS 109.77]|uniref:Origin recognition complex subunit 2 n=1 Tax=Melanomma pulvis-pyrius CBS 109.77 TaxID=1314802 RepID=A0A6A6XIM7_9PLEO|nr:ORC2-domain-containing protein [Melanomma pulvis-pyrius CBS 109.77]